MTPRERLAKFLKTGNYALLETKSEPKIGRNDPCKCGSNKKYKKCCGG